MKCCRSSVRHWITTYEETGDVQDKSGRGRKRKTSEKEDEKFIDLADTDDMISSDVARIYKKRRGEYISSRTVRRRLNEGELKYKFETAKPLLSDIHREKRLQFAKENQNRNWFQVIFADESTFTLQAHKMKIWIRRGSIKILRTVKNPSKIHVWGCISSNGFGQIICFVQILNSDLMCKIYSQQLIYSVMQFYGEGEKECSLYEDNDPKHMSKLCKAKRIELSIDRITATPQFPDLNPVENV